MRSVDADGHMRVEESRISKANVCPYKGSEIPRHAELGLDPDKIYRLYRDPEELRLAARSFEGKPLLVKHVAIDAVDAHKDLWVGTVGKVTYEHPYLIARPLMVLTKEAIDLIESKEQRELSAAYRYDALMVPGNADGEAYDGRMVNIRGNHVAIVPEGRVGPDVHVADELPQVIKAMRNATLLEKLRGFIRPGADLFAMDEILGQVPAKSVMTLSKDEKDAAEKEAADEKRKTEGEDAELTDEERQEAYERARDKKAKDKKAKDAKRAKDKDDEDDEDEGTKGGEDEKDEDGKKAKDETHRSIGKVKGADKKAKDTEPDHRKDFDPKAVDAMRDDIKRELSKQFAELDAARQAVRPVVGQVSMALDSAESVYKFALDQLGINTDGVHASAYQALLEVHQSATKRAARPAHAMDSGNVVDFDTEFFGAKRRA